MPRVACPSASSARRRAKVFFFRAYVNLGKRRNDVALGPHWNNRYCSKGDYPLVMSTDWASENGHRKFVDLPTTNGDCPIRFLYTFTRGYFFWEPSYNVNDEWGDFMGYITNFKNGCVSKCFVDRIPPNCHYMFSARFLATSHLTRWLDGLTPTGLPVTDFPMGEGSTGRVPMIFLAEAQQPPIKADRWKHKTTNMSNTNLRPEIGEVSKHSLRCTMMYIHIVLHGCARLHSGSEDGEMFLCIDWFPLFWSNPCSIVNPL